MISDVFKNCLFCILFLIASTNIVRSQYSPDEKLNIISDRGIAVLKVGKKHALYCVSQEPGLRWVNPEGVTVKGRGPSHRVHAEEVTGQLVLIFEDPRAEDKGNWTCEARNMERTIHIYVVEEATFKPQKLTETRREGGEVTLLCAASGDPAPRLGWYLNGVLMTAISNPQKYDVWEGRLVIRQLKREDSGDYECRAHQSILFWNHTSTQVIRINVRHAPIMKHNGTENVYVIYDNIHVIRCFAEAYPRPSYSWSHRTPRGEMFIPPYSGDVSTSDDGSYSDLIIRVNGKDDLGDYICYAKNPHGKNRTTFNVVRGGKPNPPTQVKYNSSKRDALLFNVDCGKCTFSSKSTTRPGSPVDLPEIAYRFELIEQEFIPNKHMKPRPVYWEESADVLRLDVPRPRGGAYALLSLATSSSRLNDS